MMERTTEERFWQKVFKREQGCWDWMGALSWPSPGKRPLPYGRFWDGTRLVLAHRYAYTLTNGPIPDGMAVDHLCRNTRCVNPAHLEAVTGAENNRRSDSVSARHAAKTHCPAGHRYDDDNTYVDAHGSRHCRSCRARRARKTREAQGIPQRSLRGRYQPRQTVTKE